jgi:hypothetical protein
MKIILVLSIAIMLSMAPVLMAGGNNVFAQNTAAQIIAQSQFAQQLGICISGDFTLISCNNLNDQSQTNFGNNAAAQSGGSGSGSGNTAFQGILQNQESTQNALCVSGDGTFLSCNNINSQDQTNFGNNALLQNAGSSDGEKESKYGWKGYKGSYGNTATQVISQNQESTQNSLVVSGGDTILSGNNVNDQTQTNFGNNAALQNSGSGSGSGGGNTATQVISQNQESTQNSACVSGGDTTASCNNFNSQSQTNYGNNALLQSR